MLKYLPYAIQGVAVIGGVAGGLFLKSMGSAPEAPPAHEEGEAGAGAHGASEEHAAKKPEKDGKAGKKDAKKKDAKKKEKKEAGHGGGHGKGADDAAYGYMKFSRQFVVPVIGQAGVTSLIVLDINIEVPPAETEKVYLQEPKLRDSLLGTLLALSNNGAFSNQILDQANLDTMRVKLLESARTIIGENAQNVLILNITRQDV
jgi:hypothetical protein